MIEFELDGKKISATPGSTILEVALKEKKYIPHFCYHKKLSIAANCRMCLVEVEKAPKPLPACATPITENMKVHTCSKLAIEAQKGVMEFLLINHPLDCPICDQGGECQLQDLAVGYGRSYSRYNEDKRAVSNKDLGSLVATEMTRCIHCSRCIRFTDEVAGYQELGMAYRNNHAEVLPFIDKTLKSELSGNIIDICPVGALTSKPFRNRARNWELSRRKSISMHDSLGSNLIVEIDKYHRVMRVLPFDNEDVNECWLSDRDRFSYEGLYHEERAIKPMIRQGNKWQEVEWDTAIAYAAKSINGIKMDHGSDAIGVIAKAVSTTEELFLLQKLMRALDINNIDYRLSQSDFRLDDHINNIPYLGCQLNELFNCASEYEAITLIGANIRFEQPLLASKIRQFVKKGKNLNVINIISEELLCEVNKQIICDARELELELIKILVAICNKLEVESQVFTIKNVQYEELHMNLANELINKKTYLLIGKLAQDLPSYSNIYLLCKEISALTKGNFGIIPRLANELGAELINFRPYQNGKKVGLNASEIITNNNIKGMVLFNTEIEYDSRNPNLATSQLQNAQTVVVFTSYINDHMLKYADVILPIATSFETHGSFINMSGKIQFFNAVTVPFKDSKPAWKVLRVLANLLIENGFEYASIEDVRKEMRELINKNVVLLNNSTPYDFVKKITLDNKMDEHLYRVSISNIYGGDGLVRRADALQNTDFVLGAKLFISSKLARKKGIKENDLVKLQQHDCKAQYKVSIDARLPMYTILIMDDNCQLGERFGAIEIM